MPPPFQSSAHGASHQGQAYFEKLGLSVDGGDMRRVGAGLVGAPVYQDQHSCLASLDCNGLATFRRKIERSSQRQTDD